jgi:hypothetical protein
LQKFNAPNKENGFDSATGKDLHFKTELSEGGELPNTALSQFARTFLTNPSKLRIYLCKIPTVITETLTM